MAAQISLSQARVATVRDVLVQQGAPASQIAGSGVGSDFPGYVQPDRDAQSNLLPGPAALNRSVSITLTS